MQAIEVISAWPTGQMDTIGPQAGRDADRGDAISLDSTGAVGDGDAKCPMSRDATQPVGDGRMIAIGDRAARQILSEDLVPPEDGDHDGAVATFIGDRTAALAPGLSQADATAAGVAAVRAGRAAR
jgi:hypothetical protein